MHLASEHPSGNANSANTSAAGGPCPVGRCPTATVLVVDDEPMVRTIVKFILEQSGYRVLEASGGREALALARACPERIDLVLSDVVMPGGGGWELVREIRKDRPGIKVLLMSGFSDEQEGCGTQGEPFLCKPFAMEVLTERIISLLGE